MSQKNGFTLVELVITIAVIGILTSISVFSFINVQKQARDSSRSFSVGLIAEALEKYHEKNGEYPSPSLLINSRSANTGDAVAALLSVDKSILVAPRAPENVTNSLSSNASFTTYGYTASSTANNADCQNSPTAECDAFTLSYVQEYDQATITVKSRHD